MRDNPLKIGWVMMGFLFSFFHPLAFIVGVLWNVMLNAVAIKSVVIALISFTSLLHCSISFQPLLQPGRSLRGDRLSSLKSIEDDSTEDWRAFRAKLVKNETVTSIDRETSWTYDTGLLIEKGSIVLSRVEDSLGCHDLRQPYFAKCVVLIVEHNQEFTQGIILNRPSNLNFESQDLIYFDDEGDQKHYDDDEASESFNLCRMFFGGDIADLYEEDPLLLCLHNHTSQMAQNVSEEVLPGVYLTSHLEARTLVGSGLPPDSFYTFYGFCGWDPGQLESEVKRGSWFMVSVDSQTLWNDLQTLREPENDPRMVGLDMWRGIVKAIGRQDEESQEINTFQDLMLKEWATEMLMVSKDEDNPAEIEDSDIYRALKAAGQPSLIRIGALVRGSSLDVSPFLLQDQFLHKSTVLILQETDDASLGLVLNLPSTDSYTVEMSNGSTITFPIRYGGPGGDGDEDPLIWLHSKESRKTMTIEKKLDEEDTRGIWACSLEHVIDSIESGIATPDDFIVVQGFCVWEKEQAGSGGIKGEVMAGKFEPVSIDETSGVWSHLLLQELLTEETLGPNFQCAIDAWNAGVESNLGSTTKVESRHVFDSNVSVSTLSNDALVAWMKIFLLGNAEYHR
jgi:putative transcriptional regulator